MSVSSTSAIKTAAASISTGLPASAVKACPRDFVDIRPDDDQGSDGVWTSDLSAFSGSLVSSTVATSRASALAKVSSSKPHERRIAEIMGLHVRTSIDEVLTTSRSTPSFVPTTLRKVLVRTGAPPQIYAHNASDTITNTIEEQHAATNAIEAMAEISPDTATNIPLEPGAYRGPVAFHNGTRPFLRASGVAAFETALIPAATPDSIMATTLEQGHALTASRIKASPIMQASKWVSGEKGTFLFIEGTTVDLEQALKGHVYTASGKFNAAGVFLVDGVPLLTADPSRVDGAGTAGSDASRSSEDNTHNINVPSVTGDAIAIEQRWLGRGKKTRSTAHATRPSSSKPTAAKGGGLLGHLIGGAKSVLGGLDIPAGHHTAAPQAAHSKTAHHTAVHSAIHHDGGGKYHTASGHPSASHPSGEAGHDQHVGTGHSTIASGNGTIDSPDSASDPEDYEAPPQEMPGPHLHPAGDEEVGTTHGNSGLSPIET